MRRVVRLSRRVQIGIGLAVVAALVIGSLVAVPFFRKPPTAYSLVDETTLLVLKGDVQVQRTGQNFQKVTDDTIVRVGDRIRTGDESFAVVTYFDGSTTTLDANTEITLSKLDKLPGGEASISLKQEVGSSWNRVEKLVGPNSRFETTTASSVAFVRGTEYRVRVQPGQQAIIESVTDTIIVETVIEGILYEVTLTPGYQTIIEPGEPPSPPELAPPAKFAFRLDVQGAVSFLLTDNNNRSIGYHPAADAFTNQIPGARYAIGGGQQSLTLPDPVESYDLTFKAQGEGGRYSANVTNLVDGEPVASSRASGLARPLAQTISGEITDDGVLNTVVLRYVPGVGVIAGPVIRGGLPAGAKVGVTSHQVGTVVQNLKDGGVLVTICDGSSTKQVSPANLPGGVIFPPCPQITPGTTAPTQVPALSTANAAIAAALQLTSQATLVPLTPGTALPTVVGTVSPTPLISPTPIPTVTAGPSPTSGPTLAPTSILTPLALTPSPQPTGTLEPTLAPTLEPTLAPTLEPTLAPTLEPTLVPTPEPTLAPTLEPTPEPTAEPTAVPTPEPTLVPTPEPTAPPTLAPTQVPTLAPTAQPTSAPTNTPPPSSTPQPSAQFATSGSSGSEAGAALAILTSNVVNIPVALSANAGAPVTVSYAVTGGTASAGIDYVLTNGSLTFASGQSRQDVAITVIDDALDEADETVVITLTGATNASLGGIVTHTFTILDDDPPPVVQFTSSSSSGEESVTTVLVAVSLSSASRLDVSVPYSVVGGTATGGGVDYTIAGGPLTFPAGTTTQDILLTVVDDNSNEPDETVVIALSTPTNATLGGTASHTYTILQNDPPSNDSFLVPVALTLPTTSLSGGNVGATTEPNEPQPLCGTVAATVWFSFTPPLSGTLNAVAATDFNAILGLYIEGTPPTLDNLSCSLGMAPSITAPVVANRTYYLQLGSEATAAPASLPLGLDRLLALVGAAQTSATTGSFTLSVSVSDTTAPTISVTSPTDGATYSRLRLVLASYICADEPLGSGLASCVGPVANGSPVDTSLAGARTFNVVARDNANNETISTVAYTVIEPTPITCPTSSTGAALAACIPVQSP